MSMFCRFIVILSLLDAACFQASYTDETNKILEDFNEGSLEIKNTEKNHADAPEILVANYNGTSIEISEDFNETSLETENSEKNHTEAPGVFVETSNGTSIEILEDFNQTSLENKDAEKNQTDAPEIFEENYNTSSIETGTAKNKYKQDPDKFDFNQTSSVTKTGEKKYRNRCKMQNMSKVQHDAFNQCISLYINGSELQTELEDSRKTGSMKMVFEKQCGKWPLINKCVENAKLRIKRCLTYSDEKLYNQTIDIVKNLQGFLCSIHDGFMLRQFVVEGGVQCVQEQYQGMKNCYNETEQVNFPETGDFLTATLSMILFTSRDSSYDCR
ncbi:unnamed protein product [Ceutorhynchus assimilis]|uniref:Uncharacterized protein n=1 Tax=Ceutorhynchus assimilis TaxID=467358 RepID=A0A9P0DFV5_9CUCU|nr:unnamed protein product [Ceutorhynchus assimilis]